MSPLRACLGASAVMVLMATPLLAAQAVTYAQDVAPILDEKCVVCHQPGNVAPMSLLSYEDARPYAQLIKTKVVNRIMPPWHMDRTIGIQAFKNDPGLSEGEIETIVRWVDGGALPGDLTAHVAVDLSERNDGSWKLEEGFGRPPDLVIRSPKYTVAQNGRDQWVILESELQGITEQRWGQAIETRAVKVEDRYVFHHYNTSIMTSSGRAQLMHANVGKDYDFYPDDTAKRLEPGAKLSFDMHFFPLADRAVEDAQAEFGIWLHPKGYEPELGESREQSFYADPWKTNGMWQHGNPCWKQPALESPECEQHVEIRGAEIVIPPHGYSTIQGSHVLDRPLRIHSLQIHMHQRGMRQTLEAIYPDGRSEVINVLNLDHRWLTTYVYEDWARPLLPKGTVLLITSQYNNTDTNPTNPDPSQWVFFGDRSIDEMSHMWIGTTWLEQDDYERLVKEQEMQRMQRESVATAADGG